MPRSRRAVPVLVILLATAALITSACTVGDTPPGTAEPGTPDLGTPPAGATGAATGEELSGDLTIYAAASLRGAFDELATEFEERHPSVEVRPIVYDGSSTLAKQLAEGAPADVFSSADELTMRTLAEAGLVTDGSVFATNTLVLAVPAGNPAEIRGLSDLDDPALTVVLCAPEVPCGAAAQELLTNAGVEASVDSYEQNVTAVLTKVAAGEADAGLVYVTDAAASSAVDTIEATGAQHVVNRYPIATLDDAANPAAAEAFVAFVLGDEGQRVLAARGFGTAP